MRILLLALLACRGAEAPRELPADSPPEVLAEGAAVLDRSWVAELARDPSRFSELVGPERAGWILLHRNALEQARSAGGAPGERARQELADLHAALARLSGRAWINVLNAWSERSGLPGGSAITWFGGLAALELGLDDQAVEWLTEAQDADSAPVREAATALLKTLSLDRPLPPDLSNPLITRFNLHVEARRTGDVADLLELADEPLWSEKGNGDTRRTFYDPQLHWTLARAWSQASPAPLDDLQALLFSGCIDAADLQAERQRLAQGGQPDARCATAPSWSALEVASRPGPTDDPQAARDRVRRMDELIANWKKGLLASVDPTGQELVQNLALVEILRSRALLAQARHALEADHPAEAAALAQLAMDMGSPRTVSPLNPPLLYATLAEANLDLGHTREALDSLQVLSTAFPLAREVDEIVGDLAILQGLDRQGDSKEN